MTDCTPPFLSPSGYYRKGSPPLEHCSQIGKEYLEEIKIAKDEEFTYNVFWEKDDKKVNLRSYYVKIKNSGMITVLLLSSIQALLGIVKEGRQPKTAIYKLYGFTKGGTDIIDLRMGYYSSKLKFPRWTVTTLLYLLDTCRINTSTIIAMNAGRNPRSQDAFQLGLSMG